jgi:hypothetical protein
MDRASPSSSDTPQSIRITELVRGDVHNSNASDVSDREPLGAYSPALEVWEADARDETGSAERAELKPN